MSYGSDPLQQVLSSSYKGHELTGNLPPLALINFESEEDILDWGNTVIPPCMDYDQDRVNTIFNNRNFYMGLQTFHHGRGGSVFSGYTATFQRQLSRIFANQIHDLIEQKVSRLTRYPAAIECMPSNAEHSDRQAARISKLFIDHLFYVNEMEAHLEDMVRHSRTDGENFLFVEWDKEKGDLMPGSEKSFTNGKRVKLVDKNGKVILNQNSEPVYIERPVRVGDVGYKIVNSYDVILDPKDMIGDCNWCIKISRVHIDELKAMHPGVGFDIEEETGSIRNSIYTQNLERPGDVTVFEIYHKYHPLLAKGRYIKCTSNVVIENTDLPYSHGELPFVRISDIRAPGELRGISFLQNLILLQVMYNQLFAILYRNIALGSHLFWLIPKAANVTTEAIRNSEGVIQFSGAVPPRIETFRTVGAEVFNLLNIVREEMGRIARVHGISRGEVPARADSGVFLAALEEQENQAQNAEIKHQNAAIRKMARLSLATAGDFYKSSDGRTLRIIGKDLAGEVEVLDVAKLSGPHEIRIRRSTALSESPATRLAQIQTIAQTFPNMLPQEQVMDMLDLANDQKFYDITTQAIRAAEREVEIMNEGEDVEPPERWEALLLHHDVHSRHIQTRSFKEAPEDVQELHLNHLLLTEGLIYEKAFIEGNPAMQQKLVTNPNFPLVFVLPKPEAPTQETGGEEPPLDEELPPMEAGAEEDITPEPQDLGTPPPPGETPQPPLPPPTERPEPGVAVEQR